MNSASNENFELTNGCQKFPPPRNAEDLLKPENKQTGMHLYSIPFSNLLDPGTAVERFVFRKVGVKKKQKKKNGGVPADPETAVEDEPHCYLPNSTY